MQRFFLSAFYWSNIGSLSCWEPPQPDQQFDVYAVNMDLSYFFCIFSFCNFVTRHSLSRAALLMWYKKPEIHVITRKMKENENASSVKHWRHLFFAESVFIWPAIKYQQSSIMLSPLGFF